MTATRVFEAQVRRRAGGGAFSADRSPRPGGRSRLPRGDKENRASRSEFDNDNVRLGRRPRRDGALPTPLSQSVRVTLKGNKETMALGRLIANRLRSETDICHQVWERERDQGHPEATRGHRRPLAIDLTIEAFFNDRSTSKSSTTRRSRRQQKPPGPSRAS